MMSGESAANLSDEESRRLNDLVLRAAEGGPRTAPPPAPLQGLQQALQAPSNESLIPEEGPALGSDPYAWTGPKER